MGYCDEEPPLGEDTLGIFADSTETLVEKDVEVANGTLHPPMPPYSLSSKLSNVARSHQVSAHSLQRLLSAFSFALLPSFVQSRWNHFPEKSPKLHPTAWLDGLRGVAALFVFFCHMSYVCFPVTPGYSSVQPEVTKHFMLLPFIRITYGGAQSVAVFFLISGYALSIKPVKQMRAAAYSDLLKTLSSATVRRFFRLFIPCLVSTFMVAMLCQVGIYPATSYTANNRELLRNFIEYHQGTFPTFWGQIRDWAKVFSNFIQGAPIGYDLHLWTIPTEYRLSMSLFLSQFAVARMTSWGRVAFIGFFALRCLQLGVWDMLLFYMGLLFAEQDVIKASWSSTRLEPKGLVADLAEPRRSKRWNLFWIGNLICGLYFASYPEDLAERTPGFMTLASLVPAQFGVVRYRYWQTIGAIQLFWAITNHKGLQNFFMTPVIHYLGKISFAMYLMHGPVLHSFGYWIMPKIWGITGTGPGQFEIGFFFIFIFDTIALIWAADLFWRAVDIPAVKFTRWIESQVVRSG